MMSAEKKSPQPSVETARYIAQTCGELGTMAMRSDMQFLCYLLEMAREEAMQVVTRARDDR